MLVIDRTKVQVLVESLLGKPWETGAKGPDKYDCWGLLQHIQKELAGREIIDAFDPPVKLISLTRYVRDHPARRQWKEVPAPVHLGAVLLAHVTHPFHVGTWLELDGGLILHSQFATGVTVDTIPALKVAGWRRFMFYDWIG